MSRRRSRPLARRRSRRHAIVFALAVALLVAVRCWQQASYHRPPEALREGTYPVRRVVDGDTFVLANQARIRLQGVDTPESVKPNHPVEPFAKEAAEFTRQFIADGEGIVLLQFDRQRVDKYGRFLAYVWVGDRMLNEELVRAGLATAETGYPYSAAMKTRFRRAEEEARAEERGIWSPQHQHADRL